MVAKHKVPRDTSKYLFTNCLVSGKKGANVLETLVSGVLSILQIAHHEANRINTQGRSHGTTSIPPN